MSYLAAVVGLSGSGKTTAIYGITERLSAQGVPSVNFHDRKTGEISQSLDDLIHLADFSPEARLFAFLAARRQIIDRYVLPALRDGVPVLMDRYYPCTIAYQAYGEGLPLQKVTQLALLGVEGALPDRIFLLDVPVSEARRRRDLREEAVMGIFDDERLAFEERVRHGYLQQAETDSRFVTIDGNRRETDISEAMAAVVLQDLLHNRPVHQRHA